MGAIIPNNQRLNDRIIKYTMIQPAHIQRENARFERQKKRFEEEFSERVDQAHFEMYLAGLAVLLRLEELRDRNSPHRYDEQWNMDFCDAVRLLPEVRECTEYFLMKCTEKKQ